MNKIKRLCVDLFDFLFPRSCVLCGKILTSSERHICLPCLMHLPRTMHHLEEHSDMEKIFWGRINVIERAFSFFFFTDASKELIHQLKYKKNTDIGRYLSTVYVNETQGSPIFDDIDVIVPVPLHWKKQFVRSYNQCHYIAQGLSELLGIEICKKAVRRVVNNKTQTLMKSHERHANVEGIFRLVNPEMLRGKHVLLVDDVATTGSTLLSCAKEISKAPQVKISVFTLAYARQSIPTVDDDEPQPYIVIDTTSLSKL